MIAIIRKYYLNFFIVFFLILLVNANATGSSRSLGANALVCLGGAIGGAAIMGTLSYKRNTKWAPAKRKKALLKSPFTELFQNGFTENNEVAVGKYHDYAVVIYYAWSAGRSSIKLIVFFDIGFHLHPSRDVLGDIVNRNQPANRFSSQAHVWTENTISCTFEYYFTAPSYEKLMAEAEKFTGILMREGLEPLWPNGDIAL